MALFGAPRGKKPFDQKGTFTVVQTWNEWIRKSTSFTLLSHKMARGNDTKTLRTRWFKAREILKLADFGTCPRLQSLAQYTSNRDGDNLTSSQSTLEQ